MSFPQGMLGRVVLKGRSGIGLSLAEQALRKKMRQQVYEALACGQVVAARLAFQAVAENSLPLLRTLREARVPLNVQQSADVLRTPAQAAVLSNNLAMLRELTNLTSRAEASSPFPPNSISQEIYTGQAASYTFTHRVGKIGAARGGKEGNGAFISWFVLFWFLFLFCFVFFFFFLFFFCFCLLMKITINAPSYGRKS